MTTIYLIRHGEVLNPKKIMYGRLPGFGLSETGKKEIVQTAFFLKKKHVDAIYSSPLLRAVQTAEIIRTQLGLEIKELSRSLLEVKSSFQGQPFAALSPDQAEVYISSKRQPSDETIEQIGKRMHKFLVILAKRHNGKRIALIGHGDPIMALKALIKNLPLTFDAIRKGKDFSYIRHGEVLELTIADDGGITVNSIFQPTV